MNLKQICAYFRQNKVLGQYTDHSTLAETFQTKKRLRITVMSRMLYSATSEAVEMLHLSDFLILFPILDTAIASYLFHLTFI